MGFGYGNGTRHNESAAYDRGGRRVPMSRDNSGVAHMWGQGNFSFGRSGNGNLYFHGPALYSYGSHYVAGYILPAPEGREWRPGVALINADSYSVSTTQHVGDAAGAVRHRTPVWVPNLTALARLFESGLSIAAEGVARTEPMPAGATWTHDAAGFARNLNRAALAEYLGPRLASHFADPDNVAGVRANYSEPGEAAELIARVFRAAGCANPEAKARKALKAAAKAKADKAAAKAKADKAAALRELAHAAARNPAEVLARIAADAKAHAPHWRADSKYGPPAEWAASGRAIFRAIKAGKAAGQHARVRAASAVRRAILTAPATFEAAALRHNRAAVWARFNREFKAAVIAAEGGPIALPHNGAPRAREGGPLRSDIISRGANAAGDMAAALGRYAGPAARLGGFDPDALAERLTAAAKRLTAAEAREARVERLAGERAEVRALKAARDMAPDCPPADRVAILKAAAAVADRYAGRVPYSWESGKPTEGGLLPPYYPAPAGYRAAGLTPARLATMAAELKAAHKAAADALKAFAAAEAEKATAESVRLWRAGQAVPKELPAMPRTAPDGSAYVRARHVERDAAGAIVGGVLETSQGATVPLAHAVRVLRFLKACRERGQGWQANGRTLPVGHFRVDRVESDGAFRAGCHTFAWAEIARLADALGLSDVAAADTTEGRAHA